MEIKLYHVHLSIHTYAGYDDYVKQHKELVTLSKALPQFAPLPLEPKTEENSGYSSRTYFDDGARDTFIITPEEMLSIIEAKVDFRLKGVINKEIDLAETFQQIGVKHSEQLEANVTTNTYNNKCDVHMPGNMLASYNELMLLEDVCTDELQSHVSSGYRIIAVCPQPDQRRPDYILGRFNPSKINDDSAKRN